MVEHISDRIGVMYLGKFAEVGTTEEIFNPPYHPYAEALLSAIPEPDPLFDAELIRLSGTVPSPISPPPGCTFHTRCPRVIQPDGISIDQVVWRSLMDLKLRARGMEELASVTAVSETDDGEAIDPNDVSREELDRLVREEFNLPDSIDPTVDEAFDELIDQLFAGEFQQAFEALASVVTTPCEEIEPATYDLGGTHRISCLLYDDAYADRKYAIPSDPDYAAVADD